MSAVRRIIEVDSDESDDEPEVRSHPSPYTPRRNLVGFWLLGLCNNFAYVIMLCAAKDILESGDAPSVNGTKTCRESIVVRDCAPISTGSVLLADIVPSLLIKISAPLFIHSIPFGCRHVLVVLLQAASFVLVATSYTVPLALTGVVLASFGSGLGELSYLSLASHFNVRVISSWSSGTGGAGILGSLIYAFLTDPVAVGLSPRTTLLLMLAVPVLFVYTYWFVLAIPSTVHCVSLFEPRSYFVPNTVPVCLGGPSSRSSDYSRPLLDDVIDSQPATPAEPTKCRVILPLLKYMIPLVLVYFGEYFINQGLVELLEFDCSHGLAMSAASQYRWYQVLYQLGVFISRSSADFIDLPSAVLVWLAVLQLLNAGVLLYDTIYRVTPHILIVFLVIFYEGLLGGASYVNTFKAIHKQSTSSTREFSMGFVSISDTLGIVCSGFLAIPAHNYICSLPL